MDRIIEVLIAGTPLDIIGFAGLCGVSFLGGTGWSPAVSGGIPLRSRREKAGESAAHSGSSRREPRRTACLPAASRRPWIPGSRPP